MSAASTAARRRARVTSARNPKVRQARRLRQVGRAGRGQGAFLVEGPRVVAEAVGHLERLFVTGDAGARHVDLVARVAAAGAEVVEVSDDVLAGLGDSVTPQGLVGVAVVPLAPLETVLATAGLVVGLVGVADPGNVGTAVRTADAAGAAGVICTRGSADPRGPKAVRASAGSLFHLPVADDVDPAQLVRRAVRDDVRVVATTPATDRWHTATDLTGPVALLFGNEAHGLPEAVLDAADDRIAVPVYGRAESLNLAACVAVVAYEAARQRQQVVSTQEAGPSLNPSAHDTPVRSSP